MFKKINWCGYTWETCMKGGRLINSKQPWMWYDENMVNVDENGVLTLNACVKRTEIEYWDGNVYFPKYAVGTIRSSDTFGYGRYSCEIMLPDGNNCWPAFWLVGEGTNWPKAGEIDIMEAFQNGSSYFRATTPYFPYINPSWWVTTNMHYEDEDGSHGYYGTRGIPICKMFKSPVKRFVKYECVWMPEKITFYADDVKLRELAPYPDISSEMHVIFDLWGQETQFRVTQPMKCKNFKYEPL